MNKTVLMIFCFFMIAIFINCPSQSLEEEEEEKVLSVTLNPVFDFFINRTWVLPAHTVQGHGSTTTGTQVEGTTGSAADTDYHDFRKLIFNFNISALSGAVIKNAYFRIYCNEISSSSPPENAKLENIFYGNTYSFPAVRIYSDEFGGYVISPVISGYMDVSSIGWKFIDVKTKLQEDISSGRSNSQFRLTHEIETVPLNYYCIWNMADNASNKPELVITYTK